MASVESLKGVESLESLESLESIGNLESVESIAWRERRERRERKKIEEHTCATLSTTIVGYIQSMIMYGIASTPSVHVMRHFRGMVTGLLDTVWTLV